MVKLWTHTYRQIIYESDPSKGLEIMRCSNKVPKSVMHDVTRGWKDSPLDFKHLFLICKRDIDASISRMDVSRAEKVRLPTLPNHLRPCSH